MAKKVLITGGCGFIGHHCIEGILKNTDWEIVNLDGLTYAGSLDRLTDIDIWPQEKHRVKFIWHDLKSPISEMTAKTIGEIDYLIHLAAESHVDKSLKNPVPFVLSNVLGTVHLLDFCKKYQPNIQKILIQGTDEIFGPAPKGVYFKEDDRYRPSNPYSGSKVGEWAMAYSYAHSFKMPIFHCISMNVYGERQNREKFIPKTVRAILNNEPVLIHGVPGRISSRCWIHARNLADAHLFLLEKAIPEESYNVVGEERSVLDLANQISQIIRGRELKENEIHYEDFHSLRPGHDLRYALSGEKMAKMGWKPKLSLDQSFEKMIRWMIKKENQKWLSL